jgi:rare lipoprotein A
MRPLAGVIAIAAVSAWMSLNAAPAAAQTFDERWSIIPNAHAEPAPAVPPESKPDLQAPPSTGQDSAPGKGSEQDTPPSTAAGSSDSPRASEDHSVSRSSNRTFTGKASFYSYQNGKTASGSSFDRNLPTAAHRSLPFGTRVRVTDLTTSRSVVVVITDRGPRARDRVLDLSLGAARSLGMTDRGVTRVRVEVL